MQKDRFPRLRPIAWTHRYLLNFELLCKGGSLQNLVINVWSIVAIGF